MLGKRGRRLGWSLILGFALGLGLLPLPSRLSWRSFELLDLERRSQAQDAAGRRHLGVGGCLSSSCHGGARGPRGQSQGDEALIWSRKDPHSKSQARLFEDYAADVVTAYNEANATNPIKDAGADPRCLRCHSDFVPPAERGPGHDLERGVTCETCHGPTEGWRDKHHLGGMAYADMLAAGRKDLRSLWQRAELCSSCHLAAPPELAAAGHPELGLDLYRGGLEQPQHWSENHDFDGLRSSFVGAAFAASKLLDRVAGDDSRLASASAEQAQAWLWLLNLAPAIDKELSAALASAGLRSKLTKFADLKGEDLAAQQKSASALAKALAGWGQAMAKETALSREIALKFAAALAAEVAARAGITAMEAELASGALLAAYHAASFGAGPRKIRKYKVPPAFKAIALNRNRYEPEDLWTEEGSLELAEFKARFAKAAALVK